MHLAAEAIPTAFPSVHARADGVIEVSGLPIFEVKLAPKGERWAPQWTEDLSAADRFLERTGKTYDRRGTEPQSFMDQMGQATDAANSDELVVITDFESDN
eukprot:936122-Pyramimonas_sp.AAC.1